MDAELVRELAALALGPAGVNAISGDSLVVSPVSVETELAHAIRDEALERGIQIAEPGRGTVQRVIIVKTWKDAGAKVDASPELFRDGWPCPSTALPAPTDDWVESRGGGDLGSFIDALRAAFRLNEVDPEASWVKRHDFLADVTERLEGLHIRSLHFAGAGGLTDLTVPIATSSIWNSGRALTRDRVTFAPNLPCEEIFAAPDWRGVRGTALISRPFSWGTGSVEGGELTVRFDGTDGVNIPDAPRSLVEKLGGRLEGVHIGEVALVDGASAAANAGVEGFGETILDENSGSHLAFGCALPMSYTDPAAADIHREGNHLDFVIGTDDMVVTAQTDEGELVLLDRGKWADEVTA